MREAIGEANSTTVSIILIAIVVSAGITIGANSLKNIKPNNSMNCSKYGYSYDSSSKKCIDAKGNKFNISK